ncbi:MAG: hypothetical protein JOY71_08995 [Acetobacteraceae bacterium]|nr:hypothetical protein [Acetobacteraceae bacterium]
MPDETLKPAIRTALRLHEIGDASPYKLCFAGKGKSGASFGFMQGDLAAGQPFVREVFSDALATADIPISTIDEYIRELSVPLITCPLSSAALAQVNAALLTSKSLVDEMDERILSKIYDHLDICISQARASDRSITAKAQLYVALWINMTGPPTKLLIWLAGKNPALGLPVPSAPNVVDGPAIEGYLRATHYFLENPHNFPHMMQCVAAAAAMAALAS